MMEIDMQYYSERLSVCTKEDKIACISTVIQLMEYHKLINHSGLESIQQPLKTEPNRFLRLSLQSLLEVPDDCSERLMTAMLLGGDFYRRDFLNAALIIQGVEMIQAHYSSYRMKQLLLTMLGEEAAALCAAKLREANQNVQ